MDSKKPSYAAKYSLWTQKLLSALLNTLPGHKKT